MYELLKNNFFKKIWVTTQNKDVKTEKSSKD